MSIDVRGSEFDLAGNLTSSGKEEFWMEVTRVFKKFDLDKIKLQPRQPIQNNKDETRGKREKLPTPPRQHRSSDTSEDASFHGTYKKHFKNKYVCKHSNGGSSHSGYHKF